ncbi:MAG TPA: prolipoprotein diacylglyceryl transferase [Verrucomicrobiae bacterium]|nr:prolipoprotein diacylglyceryl transferase [Verrucomicrobiae bacterium]
MHPIAINFGTFAIHWYGVMVAIGFLAGLWTSSRRATMVGINGEKIFDLGPWLIIGTLIGARTLYVITFWKSEFADQPFVQVFKIWEGGLVFYGGLIGATVAGTIALRIKKLPLWKTADVLAPGIALGHAFGRIGCLLNGCCYGRVCTLPWAIHFPAGHETYPNGVHPTEIYESLLNFSLYVALAQLFRRRKFDGQVFAVYLISYAIIRAFVEMFRGDYPADQIHLGLTPAQWVSVPIFAIGVILFTALRRQRAVVRA